MQIVNGSVTALVSLAIGTIYVCAQPCGDRFRPGTVAGMTLGSTTAEQIRKIIGEPSDQFVWKEQGVAYWSYTPRPSLPDWIMSMEITVNLRTKKIITINVKPAIGTLEAVGAALGCPVKLYCPVPIRQQNRLTPDDDPCLAGNADECDWMVPSRGAILERSGTPVTRVEFWVGRGNRPGMKWIACKSSKK
jgi:hypothetical protein